MSTRLDPGEFSKACDRAMRSGTPATQRAQQSWLEKWGAATERMKYLHVEQAGVSDSLRSLIRIRANLKKPNLSMDLIKPDVETLWSEMSGYEEEAVHTIYSIDDGFECSFLAVSQSGYITGSIVIRHAA